jgi:hypothetical protein
LQVVGAETLKALALLIAQNHNAGIKARAFSFLDNHSRK